MIGHKYPFAEMTKLDGIFFFRETSKVEVKKKDNFIQKNK
jgi:hypothetical protein